MKFLIKIVLLFTLILISAKADSTNVKTFIPDKLVVMTEEFETYRRVVVVLESIHDSGLLQSEPELIIGEDSESFDIIIKLEKPTIYRGKTHQQTGWYHPIDLRVIEQDSLTLIVHGSVHQFEKIVSYKLLGENQYYFDIYSKLPEQSFAQEATVPGNKQKLSYPSKITSSEPQVIKQTVKLPEAVFVLDKLVLTRSLFISACILAFVVLLSLGVIFLWKKVITKKSKPANTRQKEPPVFKISKNENHQPVQSEQAQLKDRESIIRRIMEEKKISYDEAGMYLDIKGDRLNASA